MGYYDDLLKDYRDRNGTAEKSSARDNVPEDPKKYSQDYYSNLLNDYRSGKPLNFTQPQPIQVQSKVHYGGPTVAQARETEMNYLKEMTGKDLFGPSTPSYDEFMHAYQKYIDKANLEAEDHAAEVARHEQARQQDEMNYLREMTGRDLFGASTPSYEEFMHAYQKYIDTKNLEAEDHAAEAKRRELIRQQDEEEERKREAAFSTYENKWNAYINAPVYGDPSAYSKEQKDYFSRTMYPEQYAKDESAEEKPEATVQEVTAGTSSRKRPMGRDFQVYGNEDRPILEPEQAQAALTDAQARYDQAEAAYEGTAYDSLYTEAYSVGGMTPEQYRDFLYRKAGNPGSDSLDARLIEEEVERYEQRWEAKQEMDLAASALEAARIDQERSIENEPLFQKAKEAWDKATGSLQEMSSDFVGSLYEEGSYEERLDFDLRALQNSNGQPVTLMDGTVVQPEDAEAWVNAIQGELHQKKSYELSMEAIEPIIQAQKSGGYFTVYEDATKTRDDAERAYQQAVSNYRNVKDPAYAQQRLEAFDQNVQLFGDGTGQILFGDEFSVTGHVVHVEENRKNGTATFWFSNGATVEGVLAEENQSPGNATTYRFASGVFKGSEEQVRNEAADEKEKLAELAQNPEQDVESAKEALETAFHDYQVAQIAYNYAYATRYQDLQEQENFGELARQGGIVFQRWKDELDENRSAWAEEHGSNAEYIDKGVMAYGDEYTWRTPKDNWSEDELNTFYALWSIGSREGDMSDAFQYAEDTNRQHRTEENAAAKEEEQAWGGKNFATRTLAFANGIAAAPTALWDYMLDIGQLANSGTIMPRSELTWYGKATEQGVGAAAKLNEKYGTLGEGWGFLEGKGPGDLYSLGQSVVKSMSVAGLGGGAVNALFFFDAASRDLQEQLALHPDDPGRAVWHSVWMGGAEVLGETMSVEHLVNLKESAPMLLNILTQAGIEMSEEGVTDIIGTLGDEWINGQQSKLNQMILAYESQYDMSYDEAAKAAWKDWSKDLATDMAGGFLSGGASAAGYQAAPRAAQAITNAVGGRMRYSGDVQKLMEMSGPVRTFDSVNQARVNVENAMNSRGHISNKQALELVKATSDTIRQEDLRAIQDATRNRLMVVEKSLGASDARDISSAIVNGVLDGKTVEQAQHESGKEFTQQQKQIYRELGEQLSGESSTDWLNVDNLLSTQQQKISQARMSAVETKDGGSGQVQKAVMQDGKLQLEVKVDGETKVMSQDDLKLDEYQQRALEMLSRTLGDDAAAAYNTMFSGLSYGEAFNVDDYAYHFGYVRDLFGSGATDLKKAEQAALASSIRKGMTDTQVIQAVKIGYQNSQKAISEGTYHKGTGNVSLDGGTITYNGKPVTLQGVQNKDAVLRSNQYKVVKAIAEALGKDVVFYESRAINDKGDLTGAQGAYQDGVIYLDWNAGMNNTNQVGRRMLLRTMSHEMTHAIQESSPKEYAQLKSFVTKYLAEKMGAEKFSAYVQQKRIGREGDSYSAIMDEVVADSCETMLRDSKAVRKLMLENRPLWERIRSWVRDFIQTLRGVTAEDEGAKILQGAIDELSRIWDLGLTNMVQGQKAVAESRVDVETGVGEMVNSKGQTVAAVSEETGSMQLSIRTYNEGGKEALNQFLDQQVKKNALTKQEAKEIRTQIETLYKVCKDYDNGRFAPFSAWSNASVVTYDGKPVFSVVKANGEYKLNLDFSLVCKKRRTLDAVFNEMISQGIMDDFDMVQESIARINDIIRDNGFETACGLCFVDSKRYRQGMIADAFVRMYNMQVYSLVKEKGMKVDAFNYGGDKTIQNSGQGIDTLPDSDLDWTTIDKILSTEKKTTVKWKIANYLKNNPSARRAVKRGDFMSTAGFDAVKAQNPELLSLYNSKKGAGGPKAAQSDVQYLNEIIQQGAFNPKAAYEVGGVRIQSFSDYVGRLVFDYVQMTADLAAKKLPAHSYTKEFMFAQQFGLTGIKINMSLVPEVIKGGVAAGLDANGDYAWKDGQSFGSTVYDNKGKRLTAAEGFELAKQIQNADGYSRNCGTIAVGVSDAHIRKMLDDPDIRMIIPYHKSSLNHIVAAMMNIDQYTDYTLQQNTREKKNGKWVNIPKGQEFNFNEALQRLGDAKAAANEYLAWCEKNGYKPKFDQFAGNENYYKLLEDYSCYDRDGVTNAPMGAVQMQFPTADNAFGSMSQLIEQGLEEDAILQAKQEKAVPEIVKQIQATLPEFEGTVRERNAKKGSKKAAQVGGAQLKVRTINGQKFAWIEDNILDNMPKGVTEEEYVEGYIGDYLLEHGTYLDTLPDSGIPVYAETKNRTEKSFHGLADEYAESEYTKYLRDKAKAKFVAKMRAAGVLDELVSIATPSKNKWSEARHPENKDAKYGVYKYDSIFAFPVYDHNGDISDVLAYKCSLLILNASDGKKYLYDVINIKKAPTRAKDILQMERQRAVHESTARQGGASDKKITQKPPKINPHTNNNFRASMRSDAKTDTELLEGSYKSLQKQLEYAKGVHQVQVKLTEQKQDVINRLTQEQQEALEKHHELAEDYRAKEKEVFDGLEALDKLVQDGTDPAAIIAQRQKVTAAEGRMTTALKKLAKLQERPALQEILQKEREIQRTRIRETIREGVNRKDLRRRVDALWKDLNRRITSPSEKKHIPVELMQQTIDVLQALNMDTSREGSKAGETLRSRLAALRQRYSDLKNDADFQKAAMYDAQVDEFLQRMIEEVGDTPINKMSASQLERVYETLKALDYTARRALKLKLAGEERTAYDVAMQMTRETRSVQKPKTGWGDRWINAQLSPERMFNRLGGYHKDSAWNQIYRMLDDAQLKQTQLQMEGSLIFDDLINSKEHSKDYDQFIDPKNTVDIGLKDENGNSVEITHGMLVSLWMHLQNEQNRRHVAWGGLTIPGLKEYYKGKKVKGAERATRIGGVLQEMAEINDQLHELQMSEDADADQIAELEAQRDELSYKALDYVEQLQEKIEQKLTDYDRQWIAACREMFDNFSKRVLNETTMEVYGIKRANVENYFPIWVDGDFLNTPFETVAKDMSLENAGFMKERVDSSKPIRLADVSDVAASQIRKVAQYAGLMPAIRDFNKIWGKTQTGYRDSLQKAVHQTFGESGLKYIKNLMSDLNGARGQENDAGTEFFNRMRGRMAQASLTMSLRTAMGQAASYPTAASVVGWKALHKAFWKGGRSGRMISRADQELIRKWSPLLYYRMKGYANTELGDIAGMNDKLTRVWKKAKWLTGWIQAMDGATVGRLWYAAEYWVQDNMKGLVKGSDAYYEAVAKKFNEAVELTQPNYTTMQRPDILRNPNALVRQLTMFMTQRLQNFNILYDAAAEFSTLKADYKAGRNGVTTEDVKQAAARTRTAVVSQLAAAATIVAFKAFADALLHSFKAYRDDDEKELTAEDIGLELLDMFFDSLAGNMLGGGELYDIIESKVFGKTYYGISLSGVETVTDLISAASSVYDSAVNGKISMKDVDKLAKNLAPVLGIPYPNAKKILMAPVYWIEDAKTGSWLDSDVSGNLPDWLRSGGDRTMTQQANRLLRAYREANGAKVNKILAEVPADKQDTLYENVRKRIKSDCKAGEITPYEAVRQMQKYGNANAQVMANFIKGLYEDGQINANDAKRLLTEYGGKTEESAAKTVTNMEAKAETGTSYDDVHDTFAAGGMSADDARDMLVKYGGMSEEDAKAKVDYWEYQANGGTLTEKRFHTFQSDVAPTGVDISYYDMLLPQIDANGNKSYSQEEAGPRLRDEEKAGHLTHNQAATIWSSITTGKATYDDWLEKNT